MKKCSCCGQLKPESEFQKRAASKDGLTASCRQCLKARDAARYPKEKERRAAGNKAYTQTERGAQVATAAKQKWQAYNKRKRAAHVALGNAVRDGRVTPWPVCAVPECNHKPEAHHPDYDAPLAVVWLCPSHHKRVHSQQRKIDDEANCNP